MMASLVVLGRSRYTIKIICGGVTMLHLYTGLLCFQRLWLRVMRQDVGDVVRDEEETVRDRWPVSANRVEHLLPGHRESIGRECVSVRVEDAIQPI